MKGRCGLYKARYYQEAVVANSLECILGMVAILLSYMLVAMKIAVAQVSELYSVMLYNTYIELF